MVTTVGMNQDFEVVLHNLIKLEFAAIPAYEEAIRNLANQVARAKLNEFVQDHHRHVEELSAFARHMNVDVPNGPDAKVVLTKGKVQMAELMGDKAILLAMKTNEDDTVTAYTRASEHNHVPEEIRPIVERAQADERRHRAWIESVLEDETRMAA